MKFFAPLFVSLCVLGATSMAAPQIVLELPPGPGNPRNSEGTFATLRDGRVLYAYTRFATEIREGIPDSGDAEIVARFSADGGRTWTTNDTTVVANEGAFNVCCPSLLRLQDGDLALFYLRKNSQRDCIPLMRRSADEGATWGAPWLLEDDPDGWFCYTSVHPLADGTVLLGYCAFEELAHSRIAKVPVAWLYGEAK